MMAAQTKLEDACIPNELRTSSGLNLGPLPLIASQGISRREEHDLHYDSTDIPVGTMPERRNSVRCLEFVDLFPDAGLNQPLTRSWLLALFDVLPEQRVLSSSDVKLVKLGSKLQRFDRGRRCAHPVTLQGGPVISCPSAVVEFAMLGIARHILNHADCFHTMGVDVLPSADINQEEIGLDEQCGGNIDMSRTGTPYGLGSATWVKIGRTSADGN
ncbi:hypothetical protein NDU88_004120 [Pleurodeles waltl]|uniref:Uncharacterized protein n=1 Tax=Pleurodeles waltl TaxID=8319 RepID=A0AAV7MVJ4_PLEWA|nr:hypothetical protein NDU88_004120 [Pleurodeles waltl]